MKTTYEIRQQVRTVNKHWLETIHTGGSERIAWKSYQILVDEYPNEYFELIEVFSDEKCLKFTPMID